MKYLPQVKYSLTILLAIIMVGSFCTGLLADTESQVQKAIDKALGYYNFQGEYNNWESLGISWAGADTRSKLRIKDNLQSPADYAGALMGGIAGGAGGELVNSYIGTLQGMQDQEAGHFNITVGEDVYNTLNHTIWAVIALDFAAHNGFAVAYDREKAVDYICSQQDASGGFNEGGWGVDVDSTAHALIALAADKEEKAAVIDKALEYLRNQQLDSGAFDNWGESPDSTAAVLEALTALNMDPLAESWLKEENNMVEALLSYQLDNGAFFSPWNPGEANAMTTWNALLALGDLVNNRSKYMSPMPPNNGWSLAIDGEESLALGHDAALNLVLHNSGDNASEVLAVAALYNVANEYMVTYISMFTEIKAGSGFCLGCGFPIPMKGNMK